MWMVSYVVEIALSVTHLGKVITGHFDLVLGVLNLVFKYGPDRIKQKQLRDSDNVISQKSTSNVINYPNKFSRRKQRKITKNYNKPRRQ